MHLPVLNIVAAASSLLPCLACPPADDHRCNLPAGNFSINQFQLYPENADFDAGSCLLYASSLFNSSLVVYDPNAAGKVLDIIEFPGISHNPLFHASGVGFDKNTGLLSVVINAAASFNTKGQDISGDYFLIKLDPKTKKTIFTANLTTVALGAYGGFQDVDYDPAGNSYVVGSFPAAILKVNPQGHISPWYLTPPPANHTIGGFHGIATTGWTLLADHKPSGQLWRFDMRLPMGIPVPVRITPPTVLGASGVLDGIYLPPKYKGTVLLVAEDLAGVKVLRSKDGKWNVAEYVGIVRYSSPGVFVTTTVQVGEGIYMNLVAMDGTHNVPGTLAGPQSEFPYIDITKHVDELLAV